MCDNLTSSDIEFLRSNLSMDEVIMNKIKKHTAEGSDDAFYVCDLGDVAHKFAVWSDVFPRIKPFYAVKCNDDKILLQILALLGAGFDCASQLEIEKVLSLGVHPDRIVYAHTCKHASYIRFAKTVGVDLMTFDSENELYKIKRHHPDARLILRLLPPVAEKALTASGHKFGCPVSAAGGLLKTARELELSVVGVSFHVGTRSGCHNAKAYSKAIEDARIVFDMAPSCGFTLRILDVGGGFPGTAAAKTTISEVAKEVNSALNELFAEGCGVEIIAEPGRYFTTSSCALTTNVIAKRRITNDDDETSVMYYINDGVYGSFNSLVYERDAKFTPKIPFGYGNSNKVFNSSIWGPTCDGSDKIAEDVMLPELEDGDWIFFRDVGSYTTTVCTTFNGFPRPRIYYIAKVSTPTEHHKSDISARDQFDLDMKSGHFVSSIIKPLSQHVSI